MKWVALSDTSSKWQHVVWSSIFLISDPPLAPRSSFPGASPVCHQTWERWFDSKATGLIMSTSLNAEMDSPLWRGTRMVFDCQSREKCDSLFQRRDGFNLSKWPGKLIKRLIFKWRQRLEGNGRRGKGSGMRVCLRLAAPCLSGVRNGAGKTLDVHKSWQWRKARERVQGQARWLPLGNCLVPYLDQGVLAGQQVFNRYKFLKTGLEKKQSPTWNWGRKHPVCLSRKNTIPPHRGLR